MTVPPNYPHEPLPSRSIFADLPKFSSATDDAPPEPLPNRAKTWGKYGAIWGAFCGGVTGTFLTLLSLIYRSLTLGEAVEILFGTPLAFGAMFGIIGWVKGAIRDQMLESSDIEKQRLSKSRNNEDQEWRGVKQILNRKQDDA